VNDAIRSSLVLSRAFSCALMVQTPYLSSIRFLYHFLSLSFHSFAIKQNSFYHLNGAKALLLLNSAFLLLHHCFSPSLHFILNRSPSSSFLLVLKHQ
jgi:hypothetical protein